MIPVSVPAFSDTSAGAICLVSILLVPLAMAGLALMNSGLGRSRSAAHVMLASLCAISVAAIVYVVCGFSWDGFAGGPAHVLLLHGKPWNWIAAEPFFLRGVELDGSPASLAALLQMFGVGLAALIPVSAAMDRWRLGAICASTAILPAAPIRSLRIGCGAEAGWRNWASTTGSDRASSIAEAPQPFRWWAD